MRKPLPRVLGIVVGQALPPVLEAARKAPGDGGSPRRSGSARVGDALFRRRTAGFRFN